VVIIVPVTSKYAEAVPAPPVPTPFTLKPIVVANAAGAAARATANPTRTTEILFIDPPRVPIRSKSAWLNPMLKPGLSQIDIRQLEPAGNQVDLEYALLFL
jgi:hypothetical protein